MTDRGRIFVLRRKLLQLELDGFVDRMHGHGRLMAATSEASARTYKAHCVDDDEGETEMADTHASLLYRYASVLETAIKIEFAVTEVLKRRIGYLAEQIEADKEAQP